MISDPLANVLRRFVRLQGTLCVLFSLTMPAYAVVVAFTQHGRARAARPQDPTSLIAFAAGAAVVTALSIAYRRWAYSDAHLDGLLRRPLDVRRVATEPRTGVVDEDLVARINALPAHERHFVALVFDLQSTLALNLALNEMVGLLGFVRAFMAGNVILLVPFALAAIGLNFSMWPMPEQLYTRVQTKLLTQFTT